MNLLTVLSLSCALEAFTQQPQQPISLAQARAIARERSPELAAARAALAAAGGRARQAGALTNPTVSYAYEQTAMGDQKTSQAIVAVEQPLELTGVRGARHDAAELRRGAAQADLQAAENQLDHDVTRAFALAQAAKVRLTLAKQATSAFEGAQRVTVARLVAGDASGYEARRVRLEAARYGALQAEAELAARMALVALATLLGLPPDSLSLPNLEEQPEASPLAISRDSAVALALARRPELIAAERQSAGAFAEARAVGRERIPIPVLTGGWKTEQTLAGSARLDGFVAGIALPLPLWDRKGGAVAGANAEAQRRVAELESVRRRTAREADEAYAALQAAEQAVTGLRSAVGGEATAALRAAETAYREGELSLVEWLDAVRAYTEAQTTFAALRAEVYIRRAALERATGGPLFEDR